nr:uncharacterized protein LOC104118728 [Nicotiana tomentosiformis]
MEVDAERFVAKCDKCQRYGNNMHCLAELYGTKVREIFQTWKIKQITSSPYHPVVNGQAESTNKVIISNLKKRLEESKCKWPEVLPGVLWAYRTIAKTGKGETPFSLVYGVEALIPVEIGELSMRFTQANDESNGEEMRMNLDLLEEKREAALIRMATHKQIIERYYNRKAHLRYFKIGDFVLKKVFQTTKAIGAGKLSPNWEGPYKIRIIAGKWAYELETMEDPGTSARAGRERFSLLAALSETSRAYDSVPPVLGYEIVRFYLQTVLSFI